MTKKRRIFLGATLLIVITMIVVYISYDRQRRQNLLGVSYEEYIKDDASSVAIEKFGEEKFANHDNKKQFCAAKVLWDKEIDSDHKIVLGSMICSGYIVENNSLKTSSGYNDPKTLFMLEKKDSIWQVIDYDDRLSQAAPAKSWVNEYLPQVPLDIDKKIEMKFVWAKLISKAGKALNVSTGTYNFETCSYNSDCGSGEVCVLHNLFQGEAANKCMKECSDLKECGSGYACRKTCVRGENECKYTSKNICVPYSAPDVSGFTIPNEPF